MLQTCLTVGENARERGNLILYPYLFPMGESQLRGESTGVLKKILYVWMYAYVTIYFLAWKIYLEDKKWLKSVFSFCS